MTYEAEKVIDGSPHFHGDYRLFVSGIISEKRNAVGEIDSSDIIYSSYYDVPDETESTPKSICRTFGQIILQHFPGANDILLDGCQKDYSISVQYFCVQHSRDSFL